MVVLLPDLRLLATIWNRPNLLFGLVVERPECAVVGVVDRSDGAGESRGRALSRLILFYSHALSRTV